jgi:DNA-binding NarL/FixJ family response regulator
MIRVLIVDDHTMVRESLRWGCEHAGMVVVAEAADGEDALAQVEAHRPDIVLMDLSLPRVSGVAAAKRIRALHPRMAILMLSMLSDESAVSSALSAGANGYMTKDSTMAQIIDAVVRVAGGEMVLAEGLSLPVAAEDARCDIQPRSPATAALMSKREEEVLRMMATGVSISEAAGRLYISVKTVKNHLSSIYQKLDSHDRAQAVMKAMRMGIIQLD